MKTLRTLKFSLSVYMIGFIIFSIPSCVIDDEFDSPDLKMGDEISTIQLGDMMYLNYPNNYTKVYEQNKLKYSIHSKNRQDPFISSINIGGTESYRLSNQLSGEFIEIVNIREEGNKFMFDALISTGHKFNNITITYNQSLVLDQRSGIESPKSNPIIPVLIAIERIIDALADALDEDAGSLCAKAAETCGENGVKSVDYDEGGWFSGASCTVVCQDK